MCDEEESAPIQSSFLDLVKRQRHLDRTSFTKAFLTVSKKNFESRYTSRVSKRAVQKKPLTKTEDYIVKGLVGLGFNIRVYTPAKEVGDKPWYYSGKFHQPPKYGEGNKE